MNNMFIEPTDNLCNTSTSVIPYFRSYNNIMHTRQYILHLLTILCYDTNIINSQKMIFNTCKISL